jgi:AbrB family looped-hinge helix DNA binding protein
MIKEMRSATITKKGQVSIPKESREIKGFREGSKVVIITFKDHIEIRPIKQISKGMETALLSEKTLAKDWLTPEEDKAWKHLQNKRSGK